MGVDENSLSLSLSLSRSHSVSFSLALHLFPSLFLFLFLLLNFSFSLFLSSFSHLLFLSLKSKAKQEKRQFLQGMHFPDSLLCKSGQKEKKGSLTYFVKWFTHFFGQRVSLFEGEPSFGQMTSVYSG